MKMAMRLEVIDLGRVREMRCGQENVVYRRHAAADTRERDNE